MQAEWKDGVYQVKGRPTMGRPAVFRRDGQSDIKLPVHEAYIASRALRQMAAFHRRGRKSGTTLEKVFKYLWANPGIVGKTLAPQLKQAREIIWDDPDMLFHPNVCPPSIIAKVNISDHSILLKNGSRWSLDGADDPQKKRGANVKVLHLTEAGDHDETIWTQIYEPILIENGGIAFFEGNFRGRNWYSKLFDKAMAGREGWDAFLLSARDSPIFSKADLDDLEANTPDAVFRSEYLCEAVGSMGTVFRNFERLMTLQPVEAALPKRHYKIGIDLAKKNDYTVITVIDRHTFEEVCKERFNHVDWTMIEDRIMTCIQRFSEKKNGNKAAVTIEINGVGDPVYDTIWKWTGRKEIRDAYDIDLIPWESSNPAKALLVTTLSMAFDRGTFTLLDEPETKKELGIFTYKKNSLNYIYGAPAGDENHDDTVMSLAMAVWEIGAKLPLPDAVPVKKTQWGFTAEQIRRMQAQKRALERMNGLM